MPLELWNSGKIGVLSYYMGITRNRDTSPAVNDAAFYIKLCLNFSSHLPLPKYSGVLL